MREEILTSARRCNKSKRSMDVIKTYIKGMVMTGQGDSTLMIASPNDPIEKIPEPVWYEIDGVTTTHVIWHDRLKHPIKTCLEWAVELGVSCE